MIPQVLQAPLKVNMFNSLALFVSHVAMQDEPTAANSCKLCLKRQLPVMHATNRNTSVMGQDNCATGNIDLFRWWPLFQGTLPLVNGCGWQGQCHFFVRFSHMKICIFNFLQVFETPQVLFKSSLKVTKNTDMIRHGYNMDTTILTNRNLTIITHHTHISSNKSYTIIPTAFRNFTPPVKQSVLHIHIISLLWSRLHSRQAVALGGRWLPGRHRENVSTRGPDSEAPPSYTTCLGFHTHHLVR